MPLNGPQHCFGLTDIGRVREVNEDQFLIADLSKSMVVHYTSLALDDETMLFSGTEGQLLLVADGMGGYAGGERASELAIDTVTRYVLNIMPWFVRLHEEHEDELHDELTSAVAQCEEVVDAEAASHPEHCKMGTTLAMAYVIWPRLYVVHVGDSRCYLLRGSRLEQITRDHTFAQQLVDSGALHKPEARDGWCSHILNNAIGRGPEKLSPEVYKAELEIGDTVLLCTDGLTRHVSDEAIVGFLQENRSEEETCSCLVDAANKAGGSDNITVIVARYLKE